MSYSRDTLAPAAHLIKYQALGAKLRQARKDAGLSHDRLAERVGTSRSHLIKLEKGWHRPTQPMLEAITRETGKQIEFFETGTVEDDEEEAALSFEAAIRGLVRSVLAEERRARVGSGA